ncbi:MAG TPA: hypothetical protein VKS78_04000 [Roseiarcus sp.]|nr:hypothetical protein [Roseiarcus sp.]
MQYILVLFLSLHVLAAVFWAGSTFTVGMGGSGGELLFRPQMGAAALAVATGAYLWHELHESGFGTPEQVLMLGVVCALVAAGVQGAMIGPAARRIRQGSDEVADEHARIATAQRIASGLLAVTLVSMTVSRFV